MSTTQQLAAVLAALPDPAFVLTESGRYAAIYGGTDERYYHDGSALIGKRIHDVIPKAKADWFLEQIAWALAHDRLLIAEYGLGGEDVDGLDENAGPTGTIWFEGRVQRLPELFDGERAVLWVASNITARHSLEAQLRLLSDTDELTGLANRRRLMRMLESAFEDFRRYGTPTSLLLFDIDHFKRINDTHGHQAGDAAIRFVAGVGKQQARRTDLVARLGGDEFVVLMPHTEPEQALQFGERLRATIAADGDRTGNTISGGVSSMRASDTSIEDVLKRIDVALYDAKKSGRNKVRQG